MPAFIWLAIGGTLLTVGDIVFKVWTQKASFASYGIGLLLYLFGLMCLVQSFKSENIASASAIFVIVNILTLALVSFVYFHERLSLLQMAGLGLALIAVAILELAK